MSHTPATPRVDKSGDRVREMFRQIAPRYDAMNHLLSLSIDRYWRWRTVRRLRIDGDRPVLDTCTGTGDLAIAIAERLRRNSSKTRVIATDFCLAMLEIARDKQAKWEESLQRVQFIEADSQALPFADDTFQCVTVAFGLRNVSDTDRGLQELTRVCHPGGQIVVLEFSQPVLPIVKQLYGLYFRYVLPRIGQWLARNDKSAYEYLPDSVGQFPYGQALADRMTAAGMTDVRFTRLTLGVATFYEGTKPAAVSPSKPSTRQAAAHPQRSTALSN